MKKKYTLLKAIVVAFVTMFINQLEAQTVTVNSLEELLPYLKQSNVDIKLAPGAYSITLSDIIADKYSNPLLLFEGSNNIYDFTDVTIEVEIAVFSGLGNVDAYFIQILGNNNVLKNLKWVETGNTRPVNRATTMVIDGRDNRVEGFHVTVRGSYPYGYGDAFGKGGTDTVIKHYKHSGILIRGLRNHLKDCTIISRSYGHIVFMQAASYPKVEGCYIEGEVRSTDDMLAETSGPAYDKDFMTSWGYRLPPGYTMSLQEEGIRAYDAGTTFIDGEVIQRATDNPTVINCTVKYARGGVTLSHAKGTKYVENCETIGCEQGYAIGSGTIVNSRSDAQYGPVYGTAYSSDSGVTADITILPSSTDANGSKQIAYIGGKNHNLTFRSSETNPDTNMYLKMSGVNSGVRSLLSDGSTGGLTSTNIIVNNLTGYTLLMDTETTGTTGKSCGPVVDNGTNNNILGCDEEPVGFPNPNKAYWLGNNRYLAFAAANGGDNAYSIPYHTSIGTPVPDFTEFFPSETTAYWVFTPVQDRSGYFFIDCVGGGEKPRLTATTSSGLPVMSAKTVIDASAQWSVVMPESRTTFHITNDYARIIGANTTSNQIILSATSNTTNQSRFEIVEVPSYSLSVIDHKLGEVIIMYPVPTSGILKIDFKKAFVGKVEVLDVTGKTFVSKSIKNSNVVLDLTNFPAGIYIARIHSGESVFTKKIVKK
ncbi:T9SS type A sorting domain-containing protein [Mariniflexile sp.]|uniref:T9SS type A sorting domain-containing protein n=1 Tax=Mariniflexile sp. TaxID=1979402 RepID=UPI00356435F7